MFPIKQMAKYHVQQEKKAHPATLSIFHPSLFLSNAKILHSTLSRFQSAGHKPPQICIQYELLNNQTLESKEKESTASFQRQPELVVSEGTGQSNLTTRAAGKYKHQLLTFPSLLSQRTLSHSQMPLVFIRNVFQFCKVNRREKYTNHSNNYKSKRGSLQISYRK